MGCAHYGPAARHGPGTGRQGGSGVPDGFLVIQAGQAVEPGAVARVADVDDEDRAPVAVGKNSASRPAPPLHELVDLSELLFADRAVAEGVRRPGAGEQDRPALVVEPGQGSPGALAGDYLCHRSFLGGGRWSAAARRSGGLGMDAERAKVPVVDAQ